MKKINLKCEGVQLWGDSQTFRRYKSTLKRVRPYFADEPFVDSVLDTGGRNQFGIIMAEELGLKYNGTTCDLNYNSHPHGADYIFCFETIEHLFDPLFFFEHLNLF